MKKEVVMKWKVWNILSKKELKMFHTFFTLTFAKKYAKIEVWKMTFEFKSLFSHKRGEDNEI